jgi:hypothetical protein
MCFVLISNGQCFGSKAVFETFLEDNRNTYKFRSKLRSAVQ